MGKQIIVKGEKAIAAILQFINQYHVNRLFLVCGSSFEQSEIKNEINKLHIQVIKFTGYASNPKYEDICVGVDLFNRKKCDAIMVVGGGSAIDVAKCIKLFATMDSSKNYLGQTKRDNEIPLLAIPTTAGTGSESTRYAAIYYHGEKQSVTHDSIVPNVVALVPGFLDSVPEYHKKASYMDALCQSIESWWSINSTEESKKLSKKAIKLLIDYEEDYFNDKEECYGKILEGANLAGQAINITQTTAAHAMSYKLTSLFGIAHGHAVALCLPYIWQYMNEHKEACIDSRGEEYLDIIFRQIAVALNSKTIEEAIKKLLVFIKELGLKSPKFTNDEQLEELVASVNPERLKNNPINLTESVIADLYQKIISG